MTHKDIYIKFMIEYDKANVTSSYPSLTEYEVATVLDKAYNALIAQKITGNNFRNVPLEGDLKAIEDIAPLIVLSNRTLTYDENVNVMTCNIPKEDSIITYKDSVPVYPAVVTVPIKHETGGGNYYIEQEAGTATAYLIHTEENLKGKIFYDDDSVKTFCYCFLARYDNEYVRRGNWQVGSLNQISELLNTTQFQTNTVEYIAILPGGDIYNPGQYVADKMSVKTIESIKEDDSPEMLYFMSAQLNLTMSGTPQDGITTRPVPVKLVNHNIADKFIISSYNIPWIKIPVCYIEQKTLFIVYDPINRPNYESINLVYVKQPHTFVKNLSKYGDVPYISYFDYKTYDDSSIDDYEFECNSTVAEELISLAVAFALENVESLRLTSKLNMRGLEA